MTEMEGDPKLRKEDDQCGEINKSKEEESSASILNGKTDRFGGITIDTRKVHHRSDEEFEDKLKASLLQWRDSGVRGVWISIAIEHSSLVSSCAKNGFDFHHARPGYVLMIRWLPESEPNHLPEFANQYLGAAGMAVNDRGQVLVVTERFVDKLHWKLPGGHADIGEEIDAAAIRETFEETGVHCKFVSLLTFRHLHKYRHGLSDLYFICLLEPISEEINKCDMEIAECKWMDIDEWYNDKKTSATNKFIIEAYRDYKQNGVSISNHEIAGFYKGTYNKMYKPSQVKNNGPKL